MQKRRQREVHLFVETYHIIVYLTNKSHTLPFSAVGGSLSKRKERSLETFDNNIGVFSDVQHLKKRISCSNFSHAMPWLTENNGHMKKRTL